MTVPKAAPSAQVRVIRAGGSPAVTLTGPHGERIVSPPGDHGRTGKDFVILRVPEHNMTLVALRRPSAGS